MSTNGVRLLFNTPLKAALNAIGKNSDSVVLRAGMIPAFIAELLFEVLGLIIE